jgi:DNA-directed RNA polymerase alpha subunit
MNQNTGKQDTSDIPLKLASPAQRALSNAGITSLVQLSAFSEDEIKKLHGIGPNALKQLQQALADKGLTYAGKKINP